MGPHGGWCPKGRWAEDAPIAEKYHLTETTTSDPSERTKLNVRDSDGTLILIKATPIGEGTQLTMDEAQRLNKPWLLINLSEENSLELLRTWVIENHIHTLNIAGPRASQQEGIYEDTFQFLKQCLLLIKRAHCRL